MLRWTRSRGRTGAADGLRSVLTCTPQGCPHEQRYLARRPVPGRALSRCNTGCFRMPESACCVSGQQWAGWYADEIQTPAPRPVHPERLARGTRRRQQGRGPSMPLGRRWRREDAGTQAGRKRSQRLLKLGQATLVGSRAGRPRTLGLRCTDFPKAAGVRSECPVPRRSP